MGGAIAPLGFFDPLGFTKDMELLGVKRFREAEIMHGRVAMMATLGYVIGESTPTITYGMDIHHTIGNNQIPEIPGTVLFPFFLVINICEALVQTLDGLSLVLVRCSHSEKVITRVILDSILLA